MARGGTGVASPCSDASTILFNPSGIAGTTGWTVSVGATPIQAMGSFTDDLTQTETELDNPLVFVPHAYVSYGVNERLALGFGFFVPYGLGTEWPETFEGRFNGYNNDLQSMYFQPTVAYQLNDMIKVGAGLNFVMGKVKLTQRADLSEFEAQPGVTFGMLGIPFHTDFADGKLLATGATGFGGNFGITVEPVEGISFGARYMMRVKLDYEGDVEFDPVATNIVLPPGNPLSVALGLDPANPLPLDNVLAGNNLFDAGGPLEDQSVLTGITMPDQLVAGVALDVTPSVKFLFDWQYINWTVFDTLTVDFANPATTDRVLAEDYEATHGFRFGLDVAASDNLAVRGGYLYHKGAAPPQNVTPLLPEGDRNEVTFGFGYRFGARASIDLAYQYLKQNDRRGRVREPLEGSSINDTLALNSGLYTFLGHLFGATFAVHF
jgi:long-chain fatty acid transport protein